MRATSMRNVGGVELGLVSQGTVTVDHDVDAYLDVSCADRLK